MAKQSNNLLFFDASSGLPQVISGDSVALSGDLEIGGNLTVQGTMTYIDNEILTSDAYLLMNSDYIGTSVQNGGFVINSKMTQTPGSLIQVDAALNTVIITGVHALSDGDILLLAGTADKRNDSLYEVASATNNGVNTTAVLKATVTIPELLRSSSTLVAEGQTAGAVGGKVIVAVIRSDVASSTFEYGVGSNTSMSFSDIAPSSLDLQTAYNNGTQDPGGVTVLMTAAKGDLIIAPSGAEVAKIDLIASKASKFEVTGSDTLSVKTAGGNLLLSSASGNLIGSVPNTADIKLLSGASEALNQTYGRLLLDGNAVGLRSSGSAGTLSLTAQGAIDVSTTADNITIETTAGALSAKGSTSATLESDGGVSVLADGSVTITSGLVGAGGAMTMAAYGGNLSISTLRDEATNSSAGSLTISGYSTTDVSAENGALSLSSTNGDITLTSDLDVTLTADVNGGITLSAGAVTDNGAIDLTTKALTATTATTTINTTGLAKIDSDSAITLDAATTVGLIGATGITASAPSTVISGSAAGTTTQVQLRNSDGDAVVEVVRSTSFIGARLNQSVTVGAALPNITGVSDVGVGVRVTVDAGVEVGNILAIKTTGNFDKALARRAQESDPDLPQNPFGVALANGQAAATTSGVFMSTVHGATVLLQLTSAPASSDVGAVVYLSPTTAGKGVITSNPLSLVNNDGLTRVSQIGFLLSSTAISVTGIAGSVDVYPVLWNVDHIAEA